MSPCYSTEARPRPLTTLQIALRGGIPSALVSRASKKNPAEPVVSRNAADARQESQARGVSGLVLTRCWREMDSNFWFRLRNLGIRLELN